MLTKLSDLLLIRADAGIASGIGHVMRSLALAQAWQDHCGPARFLLPPGVEAVGTRLEREGIALDVVAASPGSEADAERTARSADSWNATWVAVDGYAFGPGFQRTVRAARKVLVIDDMAHFPFYEADVLLNQNIDSERLVYECPKETILLRGTRYALLRREFAEAERPRRDFAGSAEHILVTIGGSDPQNLTGRVIDALTATPLDGAEITVVLGPQNPHSNDIARRLPVGTEKSRTSWTLVTNPDAMSPFLARADLAISAAGSTSWEIAYMGLPALFVEAAPNQKNLAQGFDRMGAARNLGPADETFEAKVADAVRDLRLSPSLRRGMSEIATVLVDGEGSARTVQAMTGSPVRLRKARRNDAITLFGWANDPVVRQSSFSPAAIPWEDHDSWFHRKLQDDRAFLFLAIDPEDAPVGELRFDLFDDGEARVDIAVDPGKRGRGIGAVMLELGIRRLSRVPSVRTIVAMVREENTASRRLFEKAGFQRDGTVVASGFTSARYVWRNAGDF